MRRDAVLGMFLVVAVCSAACAQQPPVSGPPELTCPVDGWKFTPAVVMSGDGAAGMDSDTCQHSRRGLPYPTAVVVCPRCNYTRAAGEFAAPLTDAERHLLLRELAGSRYRGVTNGLTEIPSWERYRLAAKSAAVLGKTDGELEAWLVGAWCARIEACRAASFKYSASRPVSNMIDLRRVIDDIGSEVDETKDVAERNTLLLHLAMMQQRAGSVKDRDATIAKLKTSLGADRSASARLARFEKLIAVEKEFQQNYLAALKKKEAEKDAKPNIFQAYLRADTLRRLGRDDEALQAYREARKLTAGLSEVRARIDYFLSLMAPGEPLVEPESEKVEKPDRPETPATPEEPAPAPPLP